MIADTELVKLSFYVTYVFLITTGTITFVEAISTKDTRVRHVMNIETVISVIAAFFYSKFLAKLPSIDYREITLLRYNDWFLTTPFMILSLSLVLSGNMKKKLKIGNLLAMMILNYAMLIVGYAGELGYLDRRFAVAAGFAFFAMLYGYIYFLFVKGGPRDNAFIFWIFAFLWSLYGIAYLLKENQKNISYNALDLLAKCLIGIGFWMYLSGAVQF